MSERFYASLTLFLIIFGIGQLLYFNLFAAFMCFIIAYWISGLY